MPIKVVSVGGPGLQVPKASTPYQPSGIATYSGLSRVTSANDLDLEEIDYWLSDKALGHTGQASTYYNASHAIGSEYWKRYSRPKSYVASAPILSRDLFAKPGRQSKPGNFSLAMIDLPESIGDAVVGGLGLGEAGQSMYGPPSAWYEQLATGNLTGALRGLAFLQGEMPALMLDRFVAPVTVTLSNLLGQNILGTPSGYEEDTRYPFQKTKGYWIWLRSASDSQLRAQAESIAATYVSPGRTKPIADALYTTFFRDRQSLDFRSSGDEQVDYRAKKGLEGAVEVYRELQKDGYENPAKWSPLMQKVTGLQRFPTFKEFIALPSSAQRSMASMTQAGLTAGMNNLGITPVLYLPIVGTPLANIIDRPTDEVEALWETLDPETRRNLLVGAGDVRMVTDLALGLLTIGGATSLLRMGQAVAAGSRFGAATHTLVKGYSLSLNVLDKAMAVGVGVTLATGTIQAATVWQPTRNIFGEGAPLDITALADWSAQVDAARPLSSQPVLGPVLIVAANFASGTAGFNTFLRTSAYSSTKFRNWSGTKTGINVIGVRESPFFGYRYGGGKMSGAIEAVMGLPRQHHVTAMNRDFYSYVLRLTDEMRFNLFERAVAGEHIEGAEGLSPDARIAAVRDGLNSLTSGRQATLDWIGKAISDAAESLPGGIGADTIMRHNEAKGLARTVFESVVAEQMADYGMGSSRLPKTVPELRNFVGQRMAIIDSLTGRTTASDITGFDKRLGTGNDVNTVERWTQLATSLQSIHYGLEDSALRVAMRDADGVHEPSLTIWHQRNAFQQDVESFAEVLKAGDAEAIRAEILRLMEKETFRAAYAQEIGQEEFLLSQVDPDRLYAVLGSIADALPRARSLPEMVNEGETLNAFHARLVKDGIYTLGHRAKVELPPELTLRQHMYDLLSPSEFMMQHPSAVRRYARADAIPDGYMMVPPGVVFSRKNYHELGMILDHRGRYWLKADPTLIDERTNRPIADIAKEWEANRATPQAAATVDQVQPYTGDYSDLQPAFAIALDPDAHFPLTDGSAYPASEADLFRPIAEPDPLGSDWLREGRNPGAVYPVLTDGNGHFFIFKGEKTFTREGVPTTDMNEGRLQGEVSSSKVPILLGLNTPEVIPFTYLGYRGILQEMHFADPAIPESQTHIPVLSGSWKHGYFDWAAMSPSMQAELFGHFVSDIATLQFDSNNEAFLLTGDAGRPLIGFDKGQGMAFFGYAEGSTKTYANTGREMAAAFDDNDIFWNWSGETHIAQQVDRGLTNDTIAFDWDSMVEPYLQRLEAIPDDVWLGIYEPMIQARINAHDSHQYLDGDAARALLLEHKHRIRSMFAEALSKRGYVVRRSADGPVTVNAGDKGSLLIGENQVPLNYPDTAMEAAKAAGQDAVDAVIRSRLGLDQFDTPPTDDIEGVAVIVVETMGDGSKKLWSVLDTGWDADGATFPTTDIYPGSAESDLRHAAYHWANTVYGTSVKLTGHLGDFVEASAGKYRYYIAERVAGGPREALPDAVDSMGFADLDTLRMTLAPRAKLRLDAYELMLRQDEINKFVADDPATSSTPTGEQPVDMAAIKDTEYGYVNYKRLPNGSIFRSPWLDISAYDIPATNHGNRGYIGRMYDQLFQGWRTNRIIELQRAGLHISLASKIKDVRPEVVNAFFDDLQKLRRTTLIGPRGMAMHPSMQFLATHNPYLLDITAIAHKHFGEGPYIGAKGISEIDWPQEVASAFQQSTRLNLTAGLTSHMKAMPMIGPAVTWVTDFAYPLLRFNSSPLFKGGERGESSVINWMNYGLGGTKDTMANELIAASGMRTRLDPRFEDVQTDLGLGSLDQGVHTGPYDLPRESFFGQPVRPSLLARAYALLRYPRSAHELPPEPPPKSRYSVTVGTAEIPLDPRWPDAFGPDFVQRPMLDVVRDPVTGEPLTDAAGNTILDYSPAWAHRNAEYQIAEQRRRIEDALKAVTDPQEVRQAYQALAYVEMLTRTGVIHRLASEGLLTHVAHQQGGVPGQLTKYWDQALADGTPVLAGRMSAGIDKITTEEGRGGGSVIDQDTSRRSQTGQAEWRLGQGDVRYVSFMEHGSWQAWTQSSSVPRLGMHYIIRKSVLDRALITTRDRMSEHITGYMGGTLKSMTPAGMLATYEAMLSRMIFDWARKGGNWPLINALKGNTDFYSMDPFELTINKGIDWPEIEALLIDPADISKVEDWIKAHRLDDRFLKEGTKDQSILDDIDLIPAVYEGQSPSPASGSRQDVIWRRTFEQAGLTDLMMKKAEEVRAEMDVDPVSLLRRLERPGQKWNGAAGEVVRTQLMDDGYAITDFRGWGTSIDKKLAYIAERIRLETSGIASAAMSTTSTWSGNTLPRFDALEANLTSLHAAYAKLVDIRARFDAAWDATGAKTTAEMTAEQADVLAKIVAESYDPSITGNITGPYETLNQVVGVAGMRDGGYRIVTPDGQTDLLEVGRHLREWGQLDVGSSTLSAAGSGAVEYGWDRSVTDAYRATIADYGFAKLPEGRYQKSEPPPVFRRYNPNRGRTETNYALANAIVDRVRTDHFVAALRAEAAARAGIANAPAPMLRFFIVAHDMTGDYRGPSDPMRLVVQVTGSDGQPYGNLTAQDIQSIFERTGWVTRQDQLAASTTQGDILQTVGRATDDTSSTYYPSLLFGRDANGVRNLLYVTDDYDLPLGARAGEGWDLNAGTYDFITQRQDTPRFVIEWSSGYKPDLSESYYDFQTGTLWDQSMYDVHVSSDGHTVSFSTKSYDPLVTGRFDIRVTDKTPNDPNGGGIAEVAFDRRSGGLENRETNIELLRRVVSYAAEKYPNKGIAVKLTDPFWKSVYADLYGQGGIPDRVMALDENAVIFDADTIATWRNPGMEAVLPPKPVGSIKDVEGTPEMLTEKLKEQMGQEAAAEVKRLGVKGKVAQAYDYLMNPMPAKSARAEFYAREWFRRHLPSIMDQYAPKAVEVMTSLKVPRAHWADFIAYDRYLLAEFLRTRSIEKYDALISHAEKYGKSKDVEYPGFTMNEARTMIDEFNMSPEWNALMDLWRLTLRTAEDEAYGAHFFNLNRSSFERSINHPLFGIYPASWSFKMAKQWANFLFMNRTLEGVYLGAAPAFIIRQLVYNQAVMFAKYREQNLDEIMEEGTWGPAIFAFNLIMPGDWSNLPFPLSRSLRDLIRNPTKFDVGGTIESLVFSMGTARDARLAGEQFEKIYKTLQNQDPKAWTRITSYDGSIDPWTQQGQGTAKDPTTFYNHYSYDTFVKQ